MTCLDGRSRRSTGSGSDIYLVWSKKPSVAQINNFLKEKKFLLQQWVRGRAPLSRSASAVLLDCTGCTTRAVYGSIVHPDQDL